MRARPTQARRHPQPPGRGRVLRAGSAAALVLTATIAPAQIPPATDAPRAMSPEASAAAFRLPRGFRMEVIASEPLIASPSAVAWDERGRMFVSELHGYNLAGHLEVEALNATGRLDTEVRRVQAAEQHRKAAERGTYGVVKLLSDTNGDGRMDAAAVWASDLPPVYGLVPARGGVIVASAPHIIYLADRDGDGTAEVRETLFTGFGTGELERGINAPQWGADGWIYVGRGWPGGPITGPYLPHPVHLPATDFRIRADGTAIEPVTGGTHTFGFAMTEAGDRFTVNTTIPGIYIAPLPWRYLVRNPDAPTPALEAPTGDRRAYSISRPHPWRQRRADHPAYFAYYNSRYGAAESEADGWFTAASGPLVYQDRVLPGLHGQYFVCEPAGNLIHRALIKSDGAARTLVRAAGEHRSEFAASSDPWSHPMHLSHGPDGSIWVTDYYREIIEDYSAIPRHLQQQYGLYAGHDRGRIYRLTHETAAPPPSPDMSRLDPAALAREHASPLLWRRQTAQRLVVERRDTAAVPVLRDLLAGSHAAPSTVIAALRTLEQLGLLAPPDVLRFIRHGDASVRIHALQLADRWFAVAEGRALLDETLAAAAVERDPRVQLQMALSLGEARDSRSVAMLARYARRHLSVRWMETALLSSLHGRGVDMLAALAGDPGGARPLLGPLAQAVAARQDASDVVRSLELLTNARPSVQVDVLAGLAEGRKNASRGRPPAAAARAALSALAASPHNAVRGAARALEAAFAATITATGAAAGPAAATTPVSTVSDATFRAFVAALAGRRDLERGRDVFVQACAMCHRVGAIGHHVGPDLLGQIGMAEESLLRDILMPSDRIRPGYETSVVEMMSGAAATGIEADAGATSITLRLPNGIDQVLLRKDVASVRRLPTSLMPSYADGLSPADVANLLAWLRGRLRAPAQTR